MGKRVRGMFTVKAWDEKPVAELGGGAKLTRASISGVYAGDIEGEATWESVMYYFPDGTATYVGFKRIVGRIAGRTGSVVLRTTGEFDGTEARARFAVVAGSSTDALERLTGEGTFAAPHGPQGTLELDYAFA